jgi:hypothetical protein
LVLRLFFRKVKDDLDIFIVLDLKLLPNFWLFQEVLLVGWFILVAVFLASSGEKQYHVTADKDFQNCTGKLHH